MDSGNQIPGGLFASLKIDRADGKALLRHFASYENRAQFRGADVHHQAVRAPSAEQITGVEVYSTMTETPSGKAESHYQKLDGLTIAPNNESTVYFDNESGVGLYPENRFSTYRTSSEEVKFDIEASAPGFAVARGTAVKKAGLEEAD